MMNILYGGTFNPPTKAHYEIAEHLLFRFPEAKIIFLPTANHYNKENIIDFKHRFMMLSILAHKLGPQVEVSDFESTLDKYYGTSFTLLHFNHPYFVMGADNLLTIESWINYPNIIAQNKFIVFPRNDIDIEQVFINNEDLIKYRKNFLIMKDFNNLYISSSEYRQTKNENLLIPEVNRYIKMNNLYKEED